MSQKSTNNVRSAGRYLTTALLGLTALSPLAAHADTTPAGYPKREEITDFVFPSAFTAELRNADTWRLAFATRVCVDGQGVGRFSLTRAIEGTSEADLIAAVMAKTKTDDESKALVARTLHYQYDAAITADGVTTAIELFKPLDISERLGRVDVQRVMEQSFPGITMNCPSTPLTVDTFRSLNDAADVSFKPFDPVTGQAESLHETPTEEAARMEFFKVSLPTLTVRAPDSVMAFNNTVNGKPQRAVIWTWASPFSDGRSYSIGLVQDDKAWSVRATRKGTLPPPKVQIEVESEGAQHVE